MRTICIIQKQYGRRDYVCTMYHHVCILDVLCMYLCVLNLIVWIFPWNQLEKHMSINSNTICGRHSNSVFYFPHIT
jgi:hypothetical protein